MININGEIFSKEKAKISVFDRGLLYGDSVFEVTLCYGEIPFLIEEHLDRLWNSARGLYFEPSYSREEIKKQILMTLRASKYQISYMRLILTRGSGEISLNPDEKMKNNLIIIVQEHHPLADEYYTKGVSLAYAEGIRGGIQDKKDPSLKTGNYSNNYLAYREAKKWGAYEPVIINSQGYVAEGSTCNIWMIKDGVLKTPDLKVGILSGLTRAVLLDISKKNKIPVEEAFITKEELENADEVFITSSTRMLLPVNKIQNKEIPLKDKKNSLTFRLLDLYKQFVLDYLKDQEQKYGLRSKL